MGTGGLGSIPSGPTKMEPTKLIYLENWNLLEDAASVLGVLDENGKTVVVLDRTIFYPQGGGQPYDKGMIVGTNGEFAVDEVRFADGIVKHIGSFTKNTFNIGEAVKCSVEKKRRALMSRLHSAGHIVDMALKKLDINWIPGKGFHFPEGPYVEYKGDLSQLDKEELKTDLEKSCNDIIKAGMETRMVFMSAEEMKTRDGSTTPNVPAGKPGRIVMYGDFGIPCGGTHVNNLSEIGSFTIRKIKAEGENIRIGYDVAR